MEWSVGVEKQPLESVDDAMKQMLEMVWPVRERIRGFATGHGLAIVFVCSVTFWKDRPEYSLSAPVLARLAWFGGDFLLDVFDYSDDDAD